MTVFNGCCPAPVTDVVVNRSVLAVGGGEGVVLLAEWLAQTITAPYTYTLPDTPIRGYAPMVYINGLLQSNDVHYTRSGADITILFDQVAADIQVRYAAADVLVNSADNVVRYQATQSGVTVTLPSSPGTTFPVTVYMNGVLQALTTNYTIVGSVITFEEALDSDLIQVLYSN